MSKIPLVNLGRQYEAIKVDIDSAIRSVIDSRAFIQGPFVASFETEFANFSGSRHAVGCSNGTAAISLALEALNIGPGDEVVTVAHTFAATANAICHVGAAPVFVDIEPCAYTMDMAAMEQAISPRTRAIMPVHMYGSPCDMGALRKIAAKHDIMVVEDAAQAHGAAYGGEAIGTMGSAATFSFYPGKNLGAYGDAGAIVTNDDALAVRLRKLRDHGRLDKYLHDDVGYNHRMDGMQAAILSAKLRHLPQWNERRRAIARQYDEALLARGFKTIRPLPNSKPVYHLYVVEVGNRTEVQQALSAGGIDSGVHYPVPLHRQPSFSKRAVKAFPLEVTERIVDRIISLPICGDLLDCEQERIIELFIKVARP